ncbi:CobW family GTP-binding protein [Marinomonas algarum]|uniref:GTP-binding protein n=1 Tax=Marinomonas algarum TaxID=2883105 RepID=A0A9X1LD82_9GAMM|nr:GTP-binding protein [Marinomonas algarum]MCB5162222.1 GTP-binding protein [Marinomonas algarum]
MRYQGIKVTMVTGFLGAGKTTLIRHLLEQAPPNERWAVLVNEFGDIGLDSVFYADLEVAITEVAGGCVCCTTSAAFQKGLNQLIRQHNPDRIFIEPSGLGHPKQIIQKLRSEMYRDVLLLTGVFCVLDATTLSDPRYACHDIYNDQIDSADAIVLSHMERYSDKDLDALQDRLKQPSVTKSPTVFNRHPLGLNINCLDLGLADVTSSKRNHSLFEHIAKKHALDQVPSVYHRGYESVSLLETGQFEPNVDNANRTDIKSADGQHDGGWYYQKQQDGMKVLGWLWAQNDVFEEVDVLAFSDALAALPGIYRLKGMFALSVCTQEASEVPIPAMFVNMSQGKATITHANCKGASRMEVIGDIDTAWETDVQSLCNRVLVSSSL